MMNLAALAVASTSQLAVYSGGVTKLLLLLSSTAQD